MGATGTIKRALRRMKARAIMAAQGRSPFPVFASFGWEDGTPVDRRLIDRFLHANAAAIRGRVLEVGDNEYTLRYGGDAVTRSDVLSAVADESRDVIVADISAAPQIADDTYDCIVLTQTLHYIFDMKAAVAELHRMLRPGGTLLVCVPGISQISTWDMERWGDRWRLTDLSMRELLATSFPASAVTTSTYGNAGSAVAFLLGIPAELLPVRLLSADNPEYQVLVAAAARKADA